MTKEEFWILIFSDYLSYVIITITTFLLLYIVLKKIFKTIFHPFFFYYVMIFGFCISGVVFLYFKNEINEYYLFYYLLSQILFICGIYIGKYFIGKKHIYKVRKVSIKEHSDFVFYVAFFLYFILNIITYIYFGLPVLEASRWETYKDVSGGGIIGRIIEATKIFVIFFLVGKFFIVNCKKRKVDYFILTFLILTGFLSGSKMTILEFIFIGFFAYVSLYYSGIEMKTIKLNAKKILQITVIVFAASLFTVYINQYVVNNTSVNPFLLLFGRFIASPDLQIMTYPNNILEKIYVQHSFLEIIFLDIKTLFSIIGIYFENPSLGLKAFYYQYPYLEGVVNMGPTSYFETFYLYHFGFYFGLIFSLLTGIFIGNQVFKYSSYITMQKNLLQTGLAYLSIILISNPQVYIGKIIGFILIYIFIYSLKQIIFGKNKINKKVNT